MPRSWRDANILVDTCAQPFISRKYEAARDESLSCSNVYPENLGLFPSLVSLFILMVLSLLSSIGGEKLKILERFHSPPPREGKVD